MENLKTQVTKLNLLQVEVKEELKLKQLSYVTEVQSRLQYQKAMQKITDMIQERCRDSRLVERVLQVADDVEMEYMSAAERQGGGYYPEAAAVQGSEEHNLNGKSPKSFLGYFFSS